MKDLGGIEGLIGTLLLNVLHVEYVVLVHYLV
jgi:hypothetical protein